MNQFMKDKQVNERKKIAQRRMKNKNARRARRKNQKRSGKGGR